MADPTGYPFPQKPGPVTCEVPATIPNQSDQPTPEDLEDKGETE